jgi:GTP:adenosylcobinamide-phosphate guanylyltransferase
MIKATAVVLAGSRPGVDPFAQAHGTDLKALIPVGGQPMVRRPVEALLASERVAQVLVLAQQPERIGAALPADPRLSVERSEGTIAATLGRLCSDGSVQWPLLVTTADHALLNVSMIADFCHRSDGVDLAIGVVERGSLLKRLPQTRRTWIAFRGGAYSGANLFAIGSSKAARAIDLWEGVEQDRKKGWRLLAALGLEGLLGLMRLRTLEQTCEAIGKRLGATIRPVELADPLAAVDVDKEEDLRLVEDILAGRA